LTLGIAPNRGKPRWLAFVGLIVLGFSILPVSNALATGPVGTASGFQDDDGNLIDDGDGIDWNSFTTTTWTGTVPYQVSDKTLSGWKFKGLSDAQAVTTDSGFAGGVKQDDFCGTLKNGKAPNKDDLKRIYVASQDILGHTYLNLAWVRIPQNTTSASAHVAFEFNKGTDGLCTGSVLAKRVAGDMLIVYDFEGGSAAPVLTLRKWVTTGACEISSDSAPCWGVAVNLTAGGFAEAKVNVGSTGTSDTISPSSPTSVSLADSEFGEAGIDLTAAGVFTEGTCNSFGTIFGVSRSSGNSGQAAMEDIVGPGSFNLANCGTVIIRKVTAPTGGTGFGFTDTITSNPAPTPANSPFSLDDGQSKTFTNVVSGTGKTVTEDAPTGYSLTSITCTAGSTATNISRNTTTRVLSFDISGDQTLDCTFTNTKNKANPKVDTAPSVIPQDKATVSSAFDASGAKDGKIHFELWSTNTCDTTNGGTKLYDEQQTVTAAGDYNTNNPGGTSLSGRTISSSAKDFWKVYYDGDNRNNPFDAGCSESIDVTLVGFTAP
jgi:hypothetical protein